METNPWPEGIGTWLTPESLPLWAALLVSVGFNLVQYFRGRTRPSKIVVFEANRTLFEKLREAESRLSIAFNGREVESVTMIDLAVRNEGASVIEDIEFAIEVDEQARILAIEPQQMPPHVEMTTKFTVRASNRWEIFMDYLNPVSLSEEQVRLTVFCDPEPQDIHSEGGGKGWSLEFLDQAELEAQRAKRERVRSILMIPIVVAVGVWFYAAVVFGEFLQNRFFGPTPEWWEEVLVIATEVGLILAGPLVLLWILDPIMKRLSKPYP